MPSTDKLPQAQTYVKDHTYKITYINKDGKEVKEDFTPTRDTNKVGIINFMKNETDNFFKLLKIEESKKSNKIKRFKCEGDLEDYITNNDLIADKDYIQHGPIELELLKEFKEGKKMAKKVVTESEEITAGNIKKKAMEILPKEDIDTHDSDLYLKVSDKSTELVNQMKDKDNGLLSKFKSQIDNEMWYEIPFANMDDDIKEKVQETIEVGFGGDPFDTHEFYDEDALSIYIEDLGYELLNDDIITDESTKLEVFDPSGNDGEVYVYDIERIPTDNENKGDKYYVKIKFNDKESFNMNESKKVTEAFSDEEENDFVRYGNAIAVKDFESEDDIGYIFYENEEDYTKGIESDYREFPRPFEMDDIIEHMKDIFGADTEKIYYLQDKILDYEKHGIGTEEEYESWKEELDKLQNGDLFESKKVTESFLDTKTEYVITFDDLAMDDEYYESQEEAEERFEDLKINGDIDKVHQFYRKDWDWNEDTQDYEEGYVEVYYTHGDLLEKVDAEQFVKEIDAMKSMGIWDGKDDTYSKAKQKYKDIQDVNKQLKSEGFEQELANAKADSKEKGLYTEDKDTSGYLHIEFTDGSNPYLKYTKNRNEIDREIKKWSKEFTISIDEDTGNKVSAIATPKNSSKSDLFNFDELEELTESTNSIDIKCPHCGNTDVTFGNKMFKLNEDNMSATTYFQCMKCRKFAKADYSLSSITPLKPWNESKKITESIDGKSQALSNLIGDMRSWAVAATTEYNNSNDKGYLDLAGLIEKVADKAQKMVDEELEEKVEEGLLIEKDTGGITTYDELKTQIESAYHSVFPNSMCLVNKGALGKDTFFITFYLAGDKSEFPNGIAMNDAFNIDFYVTPNNRDVELDIDQKLPETLTIEVGHNSILTTPDSPYMAYGSERVPLRKVSGTPEKIVQTITKYAQKTKDVLNKVVTEDRIPKDRIELVNSKLK